MDNRFIKLWDGNKNTDGSKVLSIQAVFFLHKGLRFGLAHLSWSRKVFIAECQLILG